MMKATYILICTLLLSVGCNNSAREKSEKIDEIKKETIQIEPESNDSLQTDAITSATSIAKDVVFNGIFVLPPQHHASITLSIDGIVKSTTLIPGQYVKKGELLATLDNPEFIDLQQQYLDAAAQSEFLEAEYRRQEALVREEAASQKRFQQSKADYLSAKSRKEAIAAQLKMLGVATQELHTNGIITLLRVHAPISGYISNLQMNLGKYIPAGEPLCEIIDKNNTLIKLTAYEKDLNKIKIGNRIEFRVNGMKDERYEGIIISVGQSVDNINRSLEVYAKVIENNELFRPGMYINARIVQK